MGNFEDYIRQGEPNKVEKAKVWKTAIGLQQVDGLKPSGYLIETAKQNIEGNITIEEVQERIYNYYKQQPKQNSENRTEEADKVSSRIAELLNEKTFTFSPVEFLSIHRRIFQDIYEHAGKMRSYNITKKEWVLNGETVLYAAAENLKETLEYDFQQEKQFAYNGLSTIETTKHLFRFFSGIWQIHPFGEGNTRTTAVFLIKYLQKLGFLKVSNVLFDDNSLYFRNALVRANYEDLSKGIYKTDMYLIRFMSNLLLDKKYILKNRELAIKLKEENVPVNVLVNVPLNEIGKAVINLIMINPKITYTEIAINLNKDRKTAQRALNNLKKLGLIERIGSDKAGHWKIIS